MDNERLLAAVIAAHPELKLRYVHIARMYGGGKTVSSVQHMLRKTRKLADTMVRENREVWQEARGYLDEELEIFKKETLRKAGVRLPHCPADPAQHLAPRHSLVTGRPVATRQSKHSSRDGCTWAVTQPLVDLTDEPSTIISNQFSDHSIDLPSSSMIATPSLATVSTELFPAAGHTVGHGQSVLSAQQLSDANTLTSSGQFAAAPWFDLSTAPGQDSIDSSVPDVIFTGTSSVIASSSKPASHEQRQSNTDPNLMISTSTINPVFFESIDLVDLEDNMSGLMGQMETDHVGVDVEEFAPFVTDNPFISFPDSIAYSTFTSED